MITHYLLNKKSAYLLLLGVTLALFFVCTFFVFPHTARAEYIDSFAVDINIKKDSSFEVTESVTYNFTENFHEIKRCLPLLHPEASTSFFKERYIDIEVVSVQMDSKDLSFLSDSKKNELCITINDSDVVTGGTHTYQITYVVRGAVSYEDFGGASLSWNITANTWNVPIRVVHAGVTSIDSVLVSERACYQGGAGKTDSCARVNDRDGVVEFVGSSLNAYEGMTISQSLNRSKIDVDIRERFTEVSIYILGSILIVAGIAYAVVRYRRKQSFAFSTPPSERNTSE